MRFLKLRCYVRPFGQRCEGLYFLHNEYTTSKPPYLINCPVNPSAIMGAVELYRTTGERHYLELANILIDNRGKKRPEVARLQWATGGNTDLNQDRTPLRQSSEVVGHAVFWSYLFAGATDAYMETGDESLMTAPQRLWLDLAEGKIYIHGGVSPVHKGLSNRSYQLVNRLPDYVRYGFSRSISTRSRVPASCRWIATAVMRSDLASDG